MFTLERLKLELLVGWQVNKNNSPVSPLQFFVVDKNDVINCTALSNNHLRRISGTKNYDQLGLFYKTYHFEATDRS